MNKLELIAKVGIYTINGYENVLLNNGDVIDTLKLIKENNNVVYKHNLNNVYHFGNITYSVTVNYNTNSIMISTEFMYVFFSFDNGKDMVEFFNTNWSIK